jgi:hypothetical protein
MCTPFYFFKNTIYIIEHKVIKQIIKLHYGTKRS